MATLAVLFIVLLGQGVAVQADPISRHVLALYDSQSEKTPADTMIHLHMEMPFNHLGFIVDFQDLRSGLPAPDVVGQYTAVVTWFTYEVPDQADYLFWARKVAETNVPFIIFGGIGMPATSQNVELLNNVLEPMGIAYTTSHVASTRGTKDCQIQFQPHGVRTAA